MVEVGGAGGGHLGIVAEHEVVLGCEEDEVGVVDHSVGVEVGGVGLDFDGNGDGGGFAAGVVEGDAIVAGVGVFDVGDGECCGGAVGG